VNIHTAIELKYWTQRTGTLLKERCLEERKGVEYNEFLLFLPDAANSPTKKESMRPVLVNPI